LFVLIRLSLHFLMPVSIPSTTGFCFHQFHLRLQISYSRSFCFRISVGATLPRREPRNYLLALAGLAISFAVPVLAQEQSTVDPEVRQQIEAVLTKFGEAQNKHDATTVADLFTLDAIRVLDWTGGGTINGREAIEKDFAVHFASSPPDVSGKLIQVCAVGDEMSTISEWSVGPWKGYSLKVYVRDADTWKIRMEYAILSMVPR
jgi:ketosteroid isomerase-like protein